MIQMVVLLSDNELKKIVRQAAEGIVKIAAECRTTKEATDILRQGSVRIVVLDLFLGGSSALDAIKTFKKMDENLALILLSRMRGRGVLEKAFRFGAADVLLYPCRAETLRNTLLHRLERMEEDMYVFPVS